MSKVAYRKPFLTYQEQLDQLKSRGLFVQDDAKAMHLLAQVSYYRLSGYWYSLLSNQSTHQFKQGATFETAFRLYCFVRELRKLVLAELEKDRSSYPGADDLRALPCLWSFLVCRPNTVRKWSHSYKDNSQSDNGIWPER